MKHIAFLTLFLSLSTLSGTLAASEEEPDLDRIEALARAAVPEVRAFVTRKLECYHWAGEEPYDQERRRWIERAVNRLKCNRLDRDEVKLRQRYKGNPQTLEALDEAKKIPL